MSIIEFGLVAFVLLCLTVLVFHVGAYLYDSWKDGRP